METVFSGVTPKGFWYEANNFSSAEHGGTHVDAPAHFAEGKWHVDSAIINPNGKLIIDSDVTLYVKGGFRLKNGAMIRIPGSSDSSLNIYMGGDFIADNSTEVINDTDNPTKLKFYGLPTCSKVILLNSADFYGAIYAPDTVLDIRNSGDIYGSFVGNNTILHNSVNFIYDYALSKGEPGNPGVKFVPTRWHEL